MKTRILSVILAVAMVLSAIPMSAFAATVDDSGVATASVTALNGDGSSDNPYQIGTADELVFAANQINGGTHGNYILTADIDMSGVEFPMIDTLTAADIFDGDEHKISNLTINDTSTIVSDSDGYRVAFVRTNKGKICNLTFENPTITTTAVSTNGFSGAAVVVGDNQKGAVITKVSVVNGTVTANGMAKAAGIAALNGRDGNNSATIRYCSFTGSLSCGQRKNTEWGPMIGGITAHNHSSILEYCIADADMTVVGGTSNNLRMGIIIGYCDSANKSTIRYNVAYGGEITYADSAATTKYTEPLRGNGGTATIEDNIVSDSITINGNSYTGTIVGAVTVRAQALKSQETYENIGWEFEDCWKMGEDGFPVFRGKEEIAPIKLEGSGTANDPYQIGDETDLLYMAKRLNKSDERLQGKYFVLTSDITMTENFPMIDDFDGEFDGAGHTISGLNINDSGNTGTKSEYRVGFIRTNYGVIKDIVFDHPVVYSDANAKENGYSGAAVVAGENQDGGVISGIRVIDATVNAPNMSKAAIITALNGRDPGKNGTISCCVVSGTLSCGARTGNFGSQIGGICSYSATSTIEYCISDVDMTIEGTPKNAYAGGICGYSNSVTYTGNVVFDGSISCYSASENIYTGRVYGFFPNNTDNNVMTNNLASQTYIINGAQVTDTYVKQGITKTSEELKNKSTYENIDYDFDLQWKYVDGVEYPVPKVFGISEGSIGCITVTPAEDASTAMNFSWYYNNESVIQLSKTEDFAEILTFNASHTDKHYHASVTGLEADTKYFYRVYDADEKIYSDAGSFTTAPTDGTFSFISMSDSCVKDTTSLKLAVSTIEAAELAVKDSRFILHSGDLLGLASTKNWQIFLSGADEVLNSTVIAPAAGENDEEGFNEYFNVGNGEGYYSFDYSNAHFVVLNTNDDETQCLSQEQLDWLKQDVNEAHENENTDWVILNLHKGPYTSGSHADDTEIAELRKVLLPLIDELDIDLVIQGHDRILGRTYSLKDGEISDERAYTEVVNGKRFDYTIDPEGTVYLQPGASGREISQQISSMDDLDEYIALFERSDQRAGSSAGTVQTFAGITIDGNRLSVSVYEVKKSMNPTMIEGFGIDKEVNKVKQLISDNDMTAARNAYDELTDTQKKEVSNYSDLVKSESGITDNAAKWLDDSALQRRSITVRNDTGLDFEDVPVRIQIENAPSEKMAFYTEDGEMLPCEVENYNVDGISTIWVKVPFIEADDVTGLWVYFGGKDSSVKSEDVWSNNYSLVEHFAGDVSDGSKITDSTGRHTGTVTGNIEAVYKNGEMAAKFDNTKIVYDSIGDDYDYLTVSAIISMDSEAQTGAIVSKYQPGSDLSTYLLEVEENNKLHSYYNCMWWRSKKMMENNYYNELPDVNGEQHLVTVTYDGFTVVTYIDGEVASEDTVFIESATLLDPDSLATVIGDYSGETSNPFKGTLYEVWIAGDRTTAEWESFRASCYLGDAVTVGKAENGTGTLTITADSSGKSEAHQTGKQQISGILSEDSQLTAYACGETFNLGNIKSGAFTVEVPVTEEGTQTVIITASANGKTANSSITFELDDSVAPKQPALSDSSDKEGQTLTVTSDAQDGEKMNVEFYINESITLGEWNLEMYEGSVDDYTPDSVDPLAGTYTKVSDIENTSTGDDSAPYQIYRFTLTQEQIKEEKYHVTWGGTSERQVHAYAYDFTNGKWDKVGSTTGTGEVYIDITVEGEQYLDENGRLYVMFFRGLGTTPDEMVEENLLIPEDGQYDFTMFWNSDTQYMTYFYPEMALHQHQWIVDNFAAKKGVITFNTGDITNRSNLNYEHNWRVTDEIYKLFEENDIPYTFVWGNHDYKYDGKPNEERLNNAYFPVSRIEENLGTDEDSWKVVGNYNGMNNIAMINEISGAKIMLLSIGYYHTSEDIKWADEIISQYEDYNVFILIHSCTYGGSMHNSSIESLVNKYDNIKIVFSGHVDGTDLVRPDEDREFYGILQDYQGEDTALTYGGQEFMRLIQFDVENNLVYFNTYSPRTGETLSLYGVGKYTQVEGLYQKNKDEFVISLDLGADSERTFTTSKLTLSAGDAKKAGTGSTVGNQNISITLSDLTDETSYEWYAVLTDAAGNKTQSLPAIFTAEIKEDMETSTDDNSTDASTDESNTDAPTDDDNTDIPSDKSDDIPDVGDIRKIRWLIMMMLLGIVSAETAVFGKKKILLREIN